jgi:hypothetical protein
MSGASPVADYASNYATGATFKFRFFKVDSDRETSIFCCVRGWLRGCQAVSTGPYIVGPTTSPGPPAGAARRIQPRPHGVCCSEPAGVSNFKKRHGNSQVYQCRNRPGPPAPPRPTPREGGSVTVPRVTNIVCIVRIVRIRVRFRVRCKYRQTRSNCRDLNISHRDGVKLCQ